MNTRTRAVAAALAATTVLVATAACSRPATSSGSDGGIKAGFSAGFLDSPFNAGLVQSVVDAAEQNGFDMLPPTDAQSDPAKQVTDVQTLLSRNIEALVLTPQDSDAIIPAVEAANAQGVPVITTDIAANGGDVYMNIRADNVLMGQLVCEQMGELLGGQGNVLEIHGDLGTSSGFDRNKGFNECMQSKYPDIQITSKDAKWKTDQAVDVAQTVLTTTQFDGVFLASDSVMLDGVTSVMKDNNLLKPAGEDGHIALVTIDGTAGSLQAIRDGSVDAVISQPVDLYGTYAVQYMQDALDGKEHEVGPTDHDSEIVEYMGNLADMLPSTVVTSDNVDDGNLWGNF